MNTKIVFKSLTTLQKLNHPNVVKYKDVRFKQNQIYIITELVKGQTIIGYLKKHEIKLTERLLRNLMR